MRERTFRVDGCFSGVSLLCLIAVSGSAAGQTDMFLDRGAWETAAASPMVMETFESEALGFVTPPTSFDSGLSADVSGSPVRMLIEAGDPDGIGLLNTTDGGRNYLRYSISDPDDFDTGTYTARFTVPQATTALGFNISDWEPLIAAGGDLGQGGTTITLLNGLQVVDEFFYQSDNNGELLFIGLLNASGFDQVRMSIATFPPLLGQTQSDDVAFDDVTWAVPAPASAMMLGLGGLAAARRRR